MDNRLLLFREDIRQTKGNNDDKYDELAIFNGHKIVLLLITSDKDSQIYESSTSDGMNRIPRMHSKYFRYSTHNTYEFNWLS